MPYSWPHLRCCPSCLAEPLPNQAALNLYYIDGTANAPLLFQLTTDFSDFTPYGDFTVDKFNAALAPLGVANISGASPLEALVKANKL